MKKAFALFLLVASLQAAEPMTTSADWREYWFQEKAARWNAKSDSDLRADAERGHGLAAYVLARRYYGLRNREEGLKWMEAAQKTGLAQALFSRANDRDVKTRPADPGKLLAQAAEAGYPPALEALGDAAFARGESGLGVEWMQKAVDGRYPHAAFELGLLYSVGVGEPRHADESPAKLFLYAARNGHIDAMHHLARRYRLGYGVPKNLVESARYRAEGRLLHLKRSYNVPPETWENPGAEPETIFLQRLAKLYRDGFENGSGAALAELAELHAANSFTEPNLPRAAALFSLAQSRGQSNAAPRQLAIQSELDPESRKKVDDELRWMKGAFLVE